MTHHRFKGVRIFMSYVFADIPQEHTDVWWKILAGIDRFNNKRKKVIQSPNVKMANESMSEFCPQTMKTVNLPHLSYILRNPGPLETEVKTLASSVLGK